jgi:hypothetical protein
MSSSSRSGCPLIYPHDAPPVPAGASSPSLIPVLLCDFIELGHTIKGVRDFDYSTGSLMKKALFASNIDIIHCKLDVGDYQWGLAPPALVEKCKGSFAKRSDLGAVRLSGLLAERKSISDLHFSKRETDGRYVVQKQRMKAVAAVLEKRNVPTALFYIIEQNLNVVFNIYGDQRPLKDMTEQAVMQLAISARAECTAESFGVIHTTCVAAPYLSNLFGTAQELIAMHCAASTTLLRCAAQAHQWPTFDEFHRLLDTAKQPGGGGGSVEGANLSPAFSGARAGGGGAGVGAGAGAGAGAGSTAGVKRQRDDEDASDVIYIGDSSDDRVCQVPRAPAARAPAQTAAGADDSDEEICVARQCAPAAAQHAVGALTSSVFEILAPNPENLEHAAFSGAHAAITSYLERNKTSLRYKISDAATGSFGDGGGTSLLVGGLCVVFVSGVEYIRCIQRFVLRAGERGGGASGGGAAGGPLDALRDAVLAAARPFDQMRAAPRFVLLVEDMSAALDSATDKLRQISAGGGKRLTPEQRELLSVPLTAHILGNLHAHLRLRGIDFLQSSGAPASYGASGHGGTARIILELGAARVKVLGAPR